MKTPHISTYVKVPLQATTKTWKTVFAYLRRSTNKQSQEDSIEHQNAKVITHARSMGIKESEITIFSDVWVSGYLNVKTKNGKILKRPRAWFSELLQAIDGSKEKCIIFAYDPSRIARNANDWWVIIERFGYWWNDQKIEAIYFCMWSWEAWTSDMKKTAMQERFNDAEKESEKKSGYMKDNINGYLQKKIFPPMIPTPPWLKATKQGMLLTEKMPYVKTAMEMRIEWKSLKEIHKYTSAHWIKTPLTNLTNTIFANSLYIWVYQDDKWEIIEDLAFLWGKPPISADFFDKLSRSIWRKVWGYWDKQWDHILPSRIKTESWSEFCVEHPKGKYRSYKWTFTDLNGKSVQINISERKLLLPIAEELNKIILGLFNVIHAEKREKQMQDHMTSLRKRVVNGKLLTEEEIQDIYTQTFKTVQNIDKTNHTKEVLDLFTISEEKAKSDIDNFLKVYTEFANKTGLDTESSEFKERISKKLQEKELEFLYALSRRDDIIIRIIEESHFFKELKRKSEVMTLTIADLKRQKIEIEEKMKTLRADYRQRWYRAEEAEEDSIEYLRKIEEIDRHIENMSSEYDISELINKIPNILAKIFELYNNAFSKAEIGDMRDDIKQILEIITFELQINTKKSLK